MRIREILPEHWWKDLDSGFLSMMGYSSEEDKPDLDHNTLQGDVKDIRSTHQPKKI